MAAVGLLYGIDGENAKGVDGKLVDIELGIDFWVSSYVRHGI